MLVRQRLVDRLHARWITPVTVISAPAGYGKTTLLAHAIGPNAAASVGIDCWLACGPDTAAASTLGDALCRAVATASSSGGTRPADTVSAVAAAIGRRSPQPVALVLDDLHEVLPGSEAAALLDAVVAALPANGHVVLSGRGVPPVRLARLTVQGRVCRIDQADLAFTDDEAKEFASLRGVLPGRVAACGGWPALAELVASERPAAVPDIAGAYIGEEVLAGVPKSTRRKLGLLAHLGPFDEALARAVLGADIKIAELLADVPLLTPMPNGKWCLHALWPEMVATDLTPADIADARRRAGEHRLERPPTQRSQLEAGRSDDLGSVGR
jgi:LuxR family maltose regulon positive regulatory protein